MLRVQALGDAGDPQSRSVELEDALDHGGLFGMETLPYHMEALRSSVGPWCWRGYLHIVVAVD